MRVVEEPTWRAIQADHDRRAATFTAAHLERRRLHQEHVVEDFLWNYYTLKPSHLHRWHPGVGITLAGGEERVGWRFYTENSRGVYVDHEQFLRERGKTARYIAELIEATLSRPASFGCFGLHEWAMVYRQEPDQVRHSTPMRMAPGEIDAVVESHSLTCTHIDAFRFFTPDATGMNKTRPTRQTQVQDEQPGCLHAGMDLYKWAGKLGPIIPGDLLLDTFELARDIRQVDMQASPYDVSAYTGADGEPLAAIAIETVAGKRDYVARQRQFTIRGNALRQRILDTLTEVL